MSICQSCGQESPDGFRFCPSCGAQLTEANPPRQARKIVTALFCDVTGSTALGEQLDPEVLRGVINRYFAEMRAIIERHGGTVEKFIGDAVMAVFGIPHVEEDDALRAVRAAVEIRDRLPSLAAEVGVALRFRTGVNTGPVLAGEGENIAIGDAINVAARFEQAAAPGEIVIGGETLQLVRDAVEVEPLAPLDLKGKSEPVRAFRLLSLDPMAAGVARHLDAPLVARERELALLTEAWDRTVHERGCHLFTLMGTAGVGKSRLVAELLARVGSSATVLRGRCLHYGEAITFWPLVEALTGQGEPADAVLRRLETGSAGAAEELFWEIRRLLESLAAETPLLLHIDDLQWGETMLLDLLDHVVDLSRGAPILVLCTARPELLETRPTWAGGKLNATTVLLEPLSAADSERLLDQLGDGLDAQARERVIASSEGNPLFLEEMVALARERGVVSVPASIQALLAARLERLESNERELLERGAVEGEVFHRLALRALAEERLPAEIELRLGRLVRKELIRPHPATLPGEAFRFRHLLIRDAAYDGLPKATRAELHQRFARWLVAQVPGLVELDEIAGWHFEQAIRYRSELGQPVDPELGRQAAEHLYSAGLRAYRRSDVAAARSLLRRAHALAPAGDLLRARAAAELAAVLADGFGFTIDQELLDDAAIHPETVLSGALTRIAMGIQAEPQGAAQRIDEQLPPLLEQLTQAGDVRGIARYHLLMFERHWLASQAAAAAEHGRLAADFAHQAEDHGLWAAATLRYTVAVTHDAETDAQRLGDELERIERRRPGPLVLACIGLARSDLGLWNGDLESARHRARSARAAVRELGVSELEGACLQNEAQIEEATGDLEAALALTEQCDAQVVDQLAFRSTTQAMIARLQSLLGRFGEAREAAELAEALSADEDLMNFAMTHAVRARLALHDGDSEAAERWARSAVELAFRTDFYRTRGEALTDLGDVLEALGQPDEAADALRRARAVYERKGHRPGVAAASARIEELAARS
jgi:class 3 adenylate cyclase/tetratricopeptide (TPR) repeat protein